MVKIIIFPAVRIEPETLAFQPAEASPRNHVRFTQDAFSLAFHASRAYRGRICFSIIYHNITHQRRVKNVTRLWCDSETALKYHRSLTVCFVYIVPLR